MKKRTLGMTGMEVTEIGFGALPLQRCTMEEAGVVLNAVLDAGINFIDTARGYTDSEEKIGTHISQRRGEYYLATKTIQRTREGAERELAASLANLKTDYIDLYQFHNVKYQSHLDAILAEGGAYEAAVEAKKQGKIRHIGITGHDPALMAKAIRTGLFETVQVPFNFIEQKALEELIPLANEMNVGIIIMKPLGGGQISQKSRSLRFILSHPISVAIPGMDEVAQITENIAAADAPPLMQAELDEMQQEADRLGPNFCRRCAYCAPCTVGIDIAQCFIFHLQYTVYGMQDSIPARYAGLDVKASACIDCGICETRCPYDIPIRQRLREVARDLG